MKQLLWRPPKSWIKTQGFGQNFNTYYASNGLAGHTSEDYSAPYDTPIPALCDLRITYIANQNDPNFKYRAVFGRYENLEISYGHLNKIFVAVGQEVKAGDIIGTMGNTGDVYVNGQAVSIQERQLGSKVGTHLHGPQIRVIKNWDTYEVENPFNGYNGCVNPEPLYHPWSIDNRTIVTQIINTMIGIFSQILKGRTL